MGSPGLNASRARPEVVRATAGTYAQRCGRFVERVVSQASSPQPAPNAARVAPTMVASEASVRTANVRAAAATTPIPNEMATTRPSGPVGAAATDEGAGVVVRVEV